MLNQHSHAEADTSASPKQAVVIDDCLYPMPRAIMRARDILDQAGVATDKVLQRDYNSPVDHIFGDDHHVDLREGNVFRTVCRCAEIPCANPHAQPKLAFVVDDIWKVTVASRQTGHSLKSLLGVPEHATLLRDYESPIDSPIDDDAHVDFRDGPVFTAKEVKLTIKVNGNDVLVKKRHLSGLQIKEAAISQGVKIEKDFILYQLKSTEGIGPAIADNTILTLCNGDRFRCVAADDNS